jgi:hypothetical protein
MSLLRKHVFAAGRQVPPAPMESINFPAQNPFLQGLFS